MGRFLVALLGGILTIAGTPTVTLGADKVITMSTTTSTQASGLLDLLLPEFAKDTGIEVKVFAKGTGAAIRDGMDGNVDLIFVHAKAREEMFISEGYGTKRYAVMHNDFVILGPKYKVGRKEGLDLEVVCEDDELLNNPYSVIPVNPAKYPHVKFDLADRFAKWLVSPRGQALIANYELLGQQLFCPDAIPDAK